MATITVVRRSRPNKDGKFPLQLRITKHRRSIRVNLGSDVLLEEWDDNTKLVTNNHGNKKRLMFFIKSRVLKAEEVLLDLENKIPDYTLEMVKTKLLPQKYNQTVFGLGDEYFDNLIKSGKFNRYMGERAALNHLKRFRKFEDMGFQDLTVSFLERFRAHLKGDLRVSERSVVNYLCTIRTIYGRALRAQIVDQAHYPFGRGKINLKKPESEKIGLEEEELILLENFELPEGSFESQARDRWLLSFYFAGMRASDTLQLRWNRFKNGRLYYTMTKNLKSDSVRIPAKAQAILDIYWSNEKKSNSLVFPDLSTVKDFTDTVEVQKKLKYRIRKINNALNQVAQDIGLSKDLTMHISRHSFATIAADKISIIQLQKLFRHSSITTTINYMKAFMYKESDEALDMVINFTGSVQKDSKEQIGKGDKQAA